VVKVFFPQRIHEGEMLDGDPESQVNALLGRLREAGIS